MKNNIEKNIQDSFDNFHPELNTDEIWENIEPRLKKKKKRRFFILWFLLGGLGLLLLFFSQKKKETFITEKQESVIHSNDAGVKATKNDEISDVVPTKKDQKNEEVLDEINPKKEAYQSGLETEQKKASSTMRSKKLPTNTSVQQQMDEGEGMSTISNHSIEKVAPNALQTHDEKDAWIEKISTKNLLDIVLESMETEADNSKQTSSKKAKTKNKKSKKKKSRKKSSKKWQAYAQIAVAPVFSLGGLSEKSSFSGSSALLTNRKETESYVDAFSAQYHLHVKNKKGFLIVGGLEYLQIDEKFYTKKMDVQVENIVGTVGIVENAQGLVTETIEGPKIRTTTKIIEQKIYNNYYYVNMPLGIGKVWEKRNSAFKLLGGVQTHLYFHFDGTILDEQSNPIEITNRNSYSYRNTFNEKIGLSAWLSGEYSRPINARLSWLLAPKIRIPISSITQKDYPLAQRQYSFHLNLGINYLLNP